MKLKPVVQNINDVPEAFREYYTQRADGAYVLELDGAPQGYVEKNRNDELRDSNINLKKQIEEMSRNVMTPEQLAEFNEMKEQQRKIKDKELIDSGKIDELVDSRLSGMRKEYETRYQALDTAHNTLKEQYRAANDQLANLSIDSALNSSLNSVGSVRKGAQVDILNRARSTWKYEDGKLVPKDSEGNIIYGKNGKEVLSMAEWCANQAEAAPYLFESSQGSGSSGNQGNSNAGNSRVISHSDKAAFISNLEGVASGKVTVFANDN